MDLYKFIVKASFPCELRYTIRFQRNMTNLKFGKVSIKCKPRVPKRVYIFYKNHDIWYCECLNQIFPCMLRHTVQNFKEMRPI